MTETSGNGWDEYRRLVLDSIQRLATEVRQERTNTQVLQQRMMDRLVESEKDVAMLKVRCGIYGLMGGLIPAAAAVLVTKL